MIGVSVVFDYDGDFDRSRVVEVAKNARKMFEGLPGLRRSAVLYLLTPRKTVWGQGIRPRKCRAYPLGRRPDCGLRLDKVGAP